MNFFKVLNFIDEFHRTKKKASMIKADPERQPKSKIFGVSSMISAALGVAFAFLAAFGIGLIVDGDLWSIIGGAVVAIIGIGGTLAAIYKAIECWAFQKYINNSPITWISLVVWMLSLGGMVVVFIMYE